MKRTGNNKVSDFIIAGSLFLIDVIINLTIYTHISPSTQMQDLEFQ